MAKARRSTAKSKARASKRPIGRKSAPKRPTGRKSAVKTGAPAASLDSLVAAAAQALALPVDPQWLPAIIANLEANLRFAALVSEFPLPDESEPAPVFSA